LKTDEEPELPTTNWEDPIGVGDILEYRALDEYAASAICSSAKTSR
jgi:hypothetical protein